MKDFFSRNAVAIVANAITVIVLIIGLAVTWGGLRVEVSHNVATISSNLDKIETLRTWANLTDIQYTEIRVKLANIEGLLLELRERTK